MFGLVFGFGLGFGLGLGFGFGFGFGLGFGFGFGFGFGYYYHLDRLFLLESPQNAPGAECHLPAKAGGVQNYVKFPREGRAYTKTVLITVT